MQVVSGMHMQQRNTVLLEDSRTLIGCSRMISRATVNSLVSTNVLFAKLLFIYHGWFCQSLKPAQSVAAGQDVRSEGKCLQGMCGLTSDKKYHQTRLT